MRISLSERVSQARTCQFSRRRERERERDGWMDRSGDRPKIWRVDVFRVRFEIIDHCCIRCTPGLPQVNSPIRHRASRASRPRIFRVEGNTSVFTIYFMAHTLSLSLQFSLGNFYLSPRQFLSAPGNEKAR